jgi:hypothetical protein
VHAGSPPNPPECTRWASGLVADGVKLPRWVIGFAKSVRPDNSGWIVTTGQGQIPTVIDVDERAGTVDFRMAPAYRSASAATWS